MSVSTNAILAFGFDLGEEWPEALDKGHDEDSGEGRWSEFLQGISGLKEPETTDYKDPAWPAHWAASREFEESFPVTVVEHCSGEYPMFFLAVRGMVTSAHRGYPQAVEAPAATVEQWTALLDFCTKHGLEWKEPAWHIFSYWG